MKIDRIFLPELQMFLAKEIPAFRCTRCARCCKGKIIPLYSADIERIGGKGNRKFLDNATQDEAEVTGTQFKMKMVKGRCVFLDGNRCQIYDLRPDTCRRHPFIMTGENTLVSSTCQGVNWDATGSKEDYPHHSQSIAGAIDRYLKGRKGFLR